jgi:putative transposase
MPRRKNQFRQGGIYHVMNRGVMKIPVFEQAALCELFLTLVKHYSKKYEISILAYCIMPNHFHILLRQDGTHSVSTFMRLVQSRFAKQYNACYGMSGAVFEKRFTDKTIDTDSYLYTVTTYIHLNPVKAKLSTRLDEWDHCNYTAFTGESGDGITNQMAIREIFGDLKAYHGVMAINYDFITQKNELLQDSS